MAEWSVKYRFLLVGSIFLVIVALGVLVLWIRVGGGQTSPPKLENVLASFDEHLSFSEVRFEIRGRKYTVTAANTQDIFGSLLRFWQNEAKKYSWKGPEVRDGKWFLIGERLPNAPANQNLPFGCARLESRVVVYPAARHVPARIACFDFEMDDHGNLIPYTLFSLTFEWKASGGILLPGIVTLTQGNSHTVLKIIEVRKAPTRRKGGRK